MEKIKERLYLAALLHDIGKFYQRADKKSYHNGIFSDSVCADENWTGRFIEQNNDIFSQIPELNLNVSEEMRALISLAALWSNGNDTSMKQPNSSNLFLFSIFNIIHNGTYNNYFPLHELSLEKDYVFPIPENELPEKDISIYYSSLWNKFCTDFRNLPTGSFRAFSESLFFTLKKYTWCIPADCRNKNGVSLFEHLKTTSALAHCLYCYKDQNPSDFIWKESDSQLIVKPNIYPLLLVGGDLSGIQNFIYNRSSRKAATSLKGRSFYLQLLIDNVIQRIIRHPEIDATIGHVVYSSGGKFYMLLPNTSNVKNALIALRHEFEQTLWKEHQGLLSLNLDYIPFTYNSHEAKYQIEGLGKGSISDLWKALADKFAESKGMRFMTLLASDYTSFFEPKDVNPKTHVCSVTGIESPECVLLDSKTTDTPIYVLPSVNEQVHLGTVLKDADYILTCMQKSDSRFLHDKAKLSICIAGIMNYLFDQSELADDKANFRYISPDDTLSVKRINNVDFLQINHLKDSKIGYGFQFYGGNTQAKNENKSIKTFEELAENTYLGVLRMDVDGLGAIFINGIPEEYKTFSAYSTLSFLLDYFFSGYLNTIRTEYADTINILYSGGDDVFAIGRWDQLILFARDIRKNFAQFVKREDISISGGLTIINSNYPIAKAATMAGEAEDEAKLFQKGKKNAINLFGETLSWDSEFSFVEEYKDLFVSLCNHQNMPVSILHKLMNYCAEMHRGELSYLWHTAYFIKRFAENKNSTVQSFLDRLMKDLSIRRNYELIAVSARWAELIIRINKQ